MLVACRLAGLSALEAHYAGLVALTQSGVLSMITSRMATADSNRQQNTGAATAQRRSYEAEVVSWGPPAGSSLGRAARHQAGFFGQRAPARR
jgi:hypothetical protein